MEVLLVLVILVILGSLAVSVFTGTQKSAYKKAAQVQVDSLSNDCQRYYLDMNAWPQDLVNLRVNPGTPNWNGAYSDKDLGPDPWGSSYHYDASGPHHNGERPDIWSDGVPGENLPIYNQ
jgi:type II secretion system protein G